MSKNVSIKEGDRARNFGPTAKIKTDLQAGGSCYWVPEDERETGHIFASENREYTPEEIGKYGIDSIDVNIIFTGTTIDGDPWSVTIDPDTGLPIIDIDDVEITIDDVTGDIDISTPDIDTTIDDADLDDFGIDPDADVDISIDDLGDIEISDGDISIDLDPETGEWDTGDCPASIKVMHVPNKTEYTDGLAIDYDGLVVQAFDEGGNPWSSPDYPGGYIPAHKLILNKKYADYSDGEEQSYIIPEYADSGDYTVLSFENVPPGGSRKVIDDGAFALERGKYSGPEIVTSTSVQGDYQGGSPLTAYIFTSIGIGDTIKLGQAYPCVMITTFGGNGKGGIAGAGTPIHIERAYSSNTTKQIYIGTKGDEVSGIGATKGTVVTNTVPVAWESPCFTELTSSFEIVVNERKKTTAVHTIAESFKRGIR